MEHLTNTTIALRSTHGDEWVLVLLNVSDQDQQFPLADTPVVPANLSSDLNGVMGTALLTLPADAAVLTCNPSAQVFLILQYHLGN